MIVVRPARVRDLPRIAIVMHRSMQPIGVREIVSHLSTRKGVWVAESSGKVVGFYIAVIYSDADRAVWLDFVGVDPSARRLKAGQALMGSFELEAACAGYGAVELSAEKSNVGAIAFYRRLGYVETPDQRLPDRICLGKSIVARGPRDRSKFGSYSGPIHRRLIEFLCRCA